MMFGKALAAIRTKKGKRQKEVAYSLGITSSSLSRIESGQRSLNLTPPLLARITAELNLSADETTYLSVCAKADTHLGTFVQGTTHDQLSLAVRFAEKLNRLKPAQVCAIDAILSLDDCP